ncbi:MAG TPA: dTDP-4-dehydrorhamnose 3,5-epimerase [Terriglobia bacterium]|nr:dTDP-4-dehydrorhamnose 3,5-epimerase [Terriglobia bacterium]
MIALQTAIPEVLIVEPRVFGDERGFFFESYNRTEMARLGITDVFVQDNHSRSVKNVVRGLHYQIQKPQGKLVRVTAGVVFDVVVDLRRASPTLGKWVGVEISADNKRMMWIPPGFAHGFAVLSEFAEFQYKTTDFYAPQFERCIRWDDPVIGIVWPLEGEPIVSPKDRAGASFAQAEMFN